MTREKQIAAKASTYIKDTHSPSYVSDFQAAMNIAAGKAFVAGAQWADETILKEVLRWLDDHTYDEQYLFNDTPDAVGIAPYHTKEAMLRSFKERFNIE